ncbi:TlpA family protein disulfide reductase [Lacibacter luteus]|nr:TlpA disulfide reductase family protein [Lacibacter luteus]
MKTIFTLSLLLLVVFTGCKEKTKNDQQEKTAPAVKTKSDLDKVKLTSLDGEPIDLNQYKGKTIFLNFWATWCKPCIQEMPSIANAMEKVNKDEVVFLFASTEDAAEIKAFQQQKPFKFHYVKVDNFESLDIMTIPTTFIFNTKGERVFNEMGYRKWDSKENINIITNSK